MTRHRRRVPRVDTNRGLHSLAIVWIGLSAVLAACVTPAPPAPPEPPTVKMNAPVDGTEYFFFQGYACFSTYCIDVPLDATANDANDGPLSGSSVVWSIEDPKGSGTWTDVATGTTGVATLVFRAPTWIVQLRVRVTDSDGMTREAFATLTLYGPPT